MNKTIQTALEIARAEIGTRESGNNRGRRVEEYQAADNLPGGGYAWCGSFVAWCLRETAKRDAVTIPWSNSASCDVIWQDARKRKLTRLLPQPGDVFLIRAKKGNGYSNSDAIHTGFVDKVNGNTFTTIEGNTNADGGREGHSVLSHTKTVSPRFVFVRWIDAVAKERPVVELPPVVAAWRVTLKKEGHTIALNVTARDGRPWVATRDFATFYGLSVAWNAVEGTAVVNGRQMEAQPRIADGVSLYPVRVLADHMGYRVSVDGTTVAVEK